MDNNIHTTDSGGQQYTHYRHWQTQYAHYRQWWTTIYTLKTVLDNNKHNRSDSGGQPFTQYTQWGKTIYTVLETQDNIMQSMNSGKNNINGKDCYGQ